MKRVSDNTDSASSMLLYLAHYIARQAFARFTLSIEKSPLLKTKPIEYRLSSTRSVFPKNYRLMPTIFLELREHSRHRQEK